MREIIFRAKNFNNGVWIQGYYVRLNGNKHFIYTGQSDVDCGNYYPDYYPVAAKTVGQFTGLTDKKGTKIFEGDILQTEDRIVVVEWHSPSASWDSKFVKYLDPRESWWTGILCSQWGEYAAVIGNIHDNPELLGGADNDIKRDY